jgi:hypothetical protein
MWATDRAAPAVETLSWAILAASLALGCQSGHHGSGHGSGAAGSGTGLPETAAASQESPEWVSAEASTRSVCDSCAVAPPNTTFSSSATSFSDCCNSVAAPLDRNDPRAAELGATTALPWVEKTFELPFEWERSWGSSTGYELETALRLQASVTGLSQLSRSAVDGADPTACANISCGDTLGMAVHVELVTQDGALHGSADLDGALALDRGSVVATSETPIENFRGSLDLGVDETRSHAGVIDISALFSPSGLQGTLQPIVRYLDPVDLMTFAPTLAEPIYGQWPVPSCGSGLPVDLDVAVPAGRGATLIGQFRDFAQQFKAQFPLPAIWISGTGTRLTVSIEAEPTFACSSGPTKFSVLVPLHLETEDGRLDTLQMATFAMEVRYTVPSWSFSSDSRPLDVAALQQSSGLADVNFADDSQAALVVGGNIDSGSVHIIGFNGTRHTRQFLSWCEDDLDCSKYMLPQFPY